MTTTESGRSTRKNSGPSRRLKARAKRFLTIIFVLAGAIAGFAYRGYVDYSDISDSDRRVLEFRTQERNLKAQVAELAAKLDAAQTKLKSVQATLDSLMPAENTYNIKPNESMVVAGGRLTVALVGPPTNQNIRINVGGTERLAVAGDIIDVAPDPSTKCRVVVQSFDMFKAILNASCAPAKPNTNSG